MLPSNIEEFSVDQNFNWKKFPLQDDKLSVLIVYDEIKDYLNTQKLVNKLLMVFPDKCYYDNTKMSWLKLPEDTVGNQLLYLEKLFLCFYEKGKWPILPTNVLGRKVPYTEKLFPNKKNNEKHTLIMDLDNLQLEDSNETKDYPFVESTKDIIKGKEEHKNIDSVDANPQFPMTFNERDIEVSKILSNKTFITHTICIAKHDKIPKSYYEKFDILIFMNHEIANFYMVTRAIGQTFGLNVLPEGKVCLTDTRLMKNVIYLYNL
jgi:hypothetical protein